MNTESLLAEGGGDYVRVATCGTPTEAHLLKGMLESNGIAANVADANFIQADTWMTQAVGGVRVLVPADQVQAARSAIAEFNAGAYELPDDEALPASKPVPLAAPVFSPDRAALLSFALTPVFGGALQLANSMAAGSRGARVRDALWLLALSVLTGVAIVMAQRLNPGVFVVFRASLAVTLVTVVWYFLVLQPVSKELVSAHGRHYPKRPTFLPAVAAFVIEVLVGFAVNELA